MSVCSLVLRDWHRDGGPGIRLECPGASPLLSFFPTILYTG